MGFLPMPTLHAVTREQSGRAFGSMLLALVLTSTALFLVFRGVDTGDLWVALARQEPGLLVAAAILIVLQIFCGGARWRAILLALDGRSATSASRVLAAFYSGIFFNNFPLGTVGGDIARVWLARQFKRPLSQIILSVLVDHVVAVIGLIILAIFTLPAVSHPSALVAWFACAGVVMLLFVAIYFFRLIGRLFGRWRDHRLVSLVLNLAGELQSLTRNRLALVAVLYALLSSVCAGVSAYCIARSLGIALSATALMAVMSMVLLVTSIPVSIAGWGVREASIVTILGVLGVSKELALLLSVEVGLLTMLVSLPGGILWMVIREEKVRCGASKRGQSISQSRDSTSGAHL